jgi:hypothetical protein
MGVKLGLSHQGKFFEKGVMPKMSGIKMNDVTGDWRIAHNRGFMFCTGG